MGEVMRSPSPAIMRAVRQIAAHPRVVEIVDNLDQDLSIVAFIDAGLNNRWKAMGGSPNGVLPTEPVLFRFSPHYPLECPDVSLRQDFDRSHPHLLPGNPQNAPKPCYIDGSPRDFLRLQGIHGLVSQIADWLEKAAAVELINPTQGWEPVRRDRLDDYVEADAQSLRALVDTSGGGAFFFAPFTQADDENERTYCCHVLERIKLAPDIAKTIFDRYDQVGIAVAVWAGRSPRGGESIADRYQPETVETVHDLFQLAETLGLTSTLTSQLNLLRERLRRTPNGAPVVISIILLVRRPIDLIGQNSHIEILPYVVEIKSISDLEPTSLSSVRLAAHSDVVSVALLSKMSGSIVEEQPRWTLLGAGSVGSKLAVHLAREGKGPRIVVDSSSMRPHNYARHGLLPLSRFGALRDIKAFSLSEAVRSLGQYANGYRTDIVWLATAASDEDRKKVWPRETKLIVDATGSPSVTDALCREEVIRVRPKAVEASLYAKGRVAYLGIEGASANPNLQDLAAESYRLISENAQLRDLVFGIDGELISVGQGCSTLTAKMSDAALSAGMPAIATTIAKLLKNPENPSYGEILIGTIDEDLLGQAWTRSKVEPFSRLLGNDTATPSIRISKRVLDMIDEAISERPGVETGGVLAGRFNESTNSFHVVDVISAPSDSKYTASLFTLGTVELAELLSTYIANTHGTLYPLGTWHNHLSDSGASPTDLATGCKLAFGQSFPALMVIKTPCGLHGLVMEAADKDSCPTSVAVVSYVGEETMETK